MNVTVYDFTGIYENESFDFYKKEGARSLYVSLSDISGTNCICDDFAFEDIRTRIRESALANTEVLGKGPRISFFDNGNYHYMSRILMEDIRRAGEPNDSQEGRIHDSEGGSEFDLVVFDHHPDMKWTSYGEILSCGCWVLRALKDIPGLSKVYIVGADKKLMEEAYADNPEIKDRVVYFENFAALREMLANSGEEVAKKVYISVDKDVLSEDELSTNWDQGDMTLEELFDGLTFLKNYYGDNVIAVDVCGECTIDDPKAFELLGFETSNRVNDSISSLFS